MAPIKPTRSELLKTKKSIKLAKTGHSLLKKKQDSLMIEFFNLLKDIKKHHQELQGHYDNALNRMNEARALESDLRIRAASLAVSEGAPVKLKIKNIAGVRIPEITRTEKEMDHPLYDSILLQDVGTAYEQVINDIITLAAKETALRKVLVEIKKTKRRAHALEHILIPKLESAINKIQFVLEEHEREEFSRLKSMKKN